MDASLVKNGLARTTSRKRRPSEAGPALAKGPIDSFPNPPAAPELPKAPPLSYKPPQLNGVEAHHTNSSSASFAQRATVLTGRSIPPDPTKPELETSIAPTSAKRERRTSLNRPIGGVYAEIQQYGRNSYPSASSPTSPRRASKPQGAHQPETRNSHLSTQANSLQNPQQDIQQEALPSQTARRTSAGLANCSKGMWAADRSPLQKLEVKLSDISKEEKRARVEEAEQRLRNSKLAAQRDTLRSLEATNNDPPRQASASDAIARSLRPQQMPLTKGSDPEDSQSQGLARGQSRRISGGMNNIRSRDLDSERAVRFQDMNGPDNIRLDLEGDDEDTEYQRDLQRPGTKRALRGSPAHTESFRQASSNTQRGSKNVPPEQQKLYSSKAEPSGALDSASAFGGQPDPVPAHAVVGRGQVPKHEVPPQTAAGIQARQRVGFGRDPQYVAEVPTRRRHHLSDVLHLGRARTTDVLPETESTHRHLDEWRHGGVAQLTADDFLDDPADHSPWWETRGSGSRRRSQRANVMKKDTYEEGHGKYNLSFSSESTGKTSSPVPFWKHSTISTHTRQYVMSTKPKESLLSRMRDNVSLLSFRSKDSQHAGLGSTYSYSCPHLADHDPSHINHICKPYLSKELTRSMRSIRLRPVPNLADFSPPLFLKCGPLLRYTGMNLERLHTQARSGPQNSERETWRGSVLIVTSDIDSKYDPAPTLRLFPEPMEKLPLPQPKSETENEEDLPIHYLDPVAGLPKLSRTGKTVYVKPVDDLQHGRDLSRFESNDDGLFEDFRTAAVPTAYGTPEYRHGQNGPSAIQANQGRRPKKGRRVTGVRLHAEREVTFWRFNLEIELQSQETRIAYSINNGPAIGFWVPARGQTMNVMFHSCNGFSLSVNPDDFSGPDPLWRDVLNSHQIRPFHVMIGGGDQIYNDVVMRQSPLFGDWLEIKNPHHKHKAEFSPEMQEELETFYLERYSMWFSQGLFGMANSQIPMVNMWDDHDIIDGFGSYPHHFMSTKVFCGLGAIAFKYYMLFQHQSVPDETSADEPSWLLGAAPGPYINEHSRSVYMSLGKKVAFLGLDCRTERMREEILSEASYDIIFDRCRREIREGETKHLIVLLGVPIAYPRLVWLENVLTSRALDPIKAIGRMGMLGGFLNKFDGGVEILDDLDDHWTAKNHKQERNWFVQELQELAAEKSVRVTILGGDVHLAAVGQFYSNPKLKIPKDRDHRYMANVISSAIVNTPPPEMMSDILNKRNKTHHLDPETDESMIPMFTHDVDGKPRNNKRLLPRRNWCSIREYYPGSTPPPTPSPLGLETPSDVTPPSPTRLQRTLSLTRGDIRPGIFIRRLSGRGSPRTNGYMPSNRYDSESPPDSPPMDGYFPRQAQINRSSTAPANGVATQRHSSAPLLRPGNFLRRPTNMSEKAATRGDTGDSSGHIDLKHGLDIVLNCEADQRDPAGVTRPYRLLIPALFYQGKSDENTTSYRKQSLLQRFSSLRNRRVSKVASGQGQGNWGQESLSATESEGEVQEEEPIRPRRWSFGLERRRRYRDQSPLQKRALQDMRSPSQLDPANEAQRLGVFQERPARQRQPQSQRQFEDRNQQIGRSSDQQQDQEQQYDIPAPRQARKFEAFDDYDYDYDYDDGPPPRDRMDSVDYHANLDTGKGAQNGGYPERRLSKVDRMLGFDGGPDYTEVGDAEAISGDQYDNDRNKPRPTSKRLSGYSGIEAYSEEKKGWRRSLRLF